MIDKRVEQSISLIAEKCNGIDYKTAVNKFTRERKMNQKDFVWYLTIQKGRTTSMELDEYLQHKNGTYEISISKQAFSKYLKPEIFADLAEDLSKGSLSEVSCRSKKI